ncbi:hypothetical protein ACQJBY_071919 [Aegilops geniculata]
MQYVLETTVYPREHERLRELRLITQQHAKSFTGSSPDQMQFFSVLLKMIGANNTIEVGVFTGYSLLTTALALPAGGKILAGTYVGGGDRCEPGVLRAGPAGDREGRRGAQGGLPRGRRARGARQDPVRGRRRQGRHVRLGVRGRGQAAVRGVPRAAAAPGARRRRHRLRQHALGRLRGDAPRQAGQLRVRPPGAGQLPCVQRRRRGGRPRRGLHRPHRRRRHAVPPRQVK